MTKRKNLITVIRLITACFCLITNPANTVFPKYFHINMRYSWNYNAVLIQRFRNEVLVFNFCSDFAWLSNSKIRCSFLELIKNALTILKYLSIVASS